MIPPQSFKIKIPKQYQFKEALWFLDRNFNDCMQLVEGEQLWKAIDLNGKIFLLRIYQDDLNLQVQIEAGKPSIMEIDALRKYVIQWLDLEMDIDPFYTLLSLNEEVAYMANSFKGLPLIGIVDFFETLCWCIIGQQINLSFAHTLKRKLVERYGKSVKQNGRTYLVFPKPEIIAKLNVEDLKNMQFSGRKAEYIIHIAQKIQEGSLSKEMILLAPDFPSKQKILTSLRGIGLWTANYTLLKCFRESAAVPYGDAGLIKAFLNHCLITTKTEETKMKAYFEKFKGWENYLVIYLWRSLVPKLSDDKVKTKQVSG